MLLVRRVADHVQEDTIPEAIRPGLMLREAVLNSSDWWVENRVCFFKKRLEVGVRCSFTLLPFFNGWIKK